MGEGYPINWAANPNDLALTRHPLYVKYNQTPIGTILKADVQTDLAAILPTTGSAQICAYLSWLIRLKELTA